MWQFNKRLTCFIFSSALVASLCATAFSASKPDWIEGKTRKYPANSYLTGVGYGDSRKAAEDAAYAAISRIFQAEIRQRTREWEKYAQTDIKGKTHTSRDIQVDQITSVATSKALEDITVAEIWVDESENRIYALAVMDRAHAMNSLREKIGAADRDVAALKQKAGSVQDKIEAVRALRSALKILLDREVYNTDLRIVNPVGRGIDPPVGLISIKQRLQDVLSREIHVGVDVEGPHGMEIRAAILEGLTREGFSVEDKGNSDRLDIMVRGVADLENADLPQWKFVRWTITVDLVNQKSGKIFGSFTRHGREGHLNFREAEAKAVRELQKDIVNELSRLLVSFIYGGDEKSGG